MKRILISVIFIFALGAGLHAQEIAPISDEAQTLAQQQNTVQGGSQKNIQIVIALCIVITGAAGLVTHNRTED